jgi:hypothetical protein
VARVVAIAVRRAAALALLALAACASWQPPADVSDAPLRARAVSGSNEGVRVSAAVLSAEDSRRMLGMDVGDSRVQAVWVEVQNTTQRAMWLLRTGTDPDYFSPLETAWSAHALLGGATNAQIDRHFDELGFKNPIPPGSTRAGLVFTNPERGMKLLNVDLLSAKALVPITLFLPVPLETAGTGHTARANAFAYPSSQVADHRDLAALRAALERLPCCAEVAGVPQGDPLNVVFIGTLEDIGAAVVRRNFQRDTHASDLADSVFGRSADAVLRKQGHGRTPAVWIRAWLAPLTFEGRPVYLAQAGRPVGGRFAPRDLQQPLAHPDIDEARNLLVQDMMYSGGLDKLGFLHGGQASGRGDGLRAVMFFATRPLSLSEVEILEWVPYLSAP